MVTWETTLLLACVLHVCVSQRNDQDYIYIFPQKLLLTESESKGEVKVTCRQLPIPAGTKANTLKISRKPIRVDPGSSSAEEELFEFSSDGRLHEGTPGSNGIRFKVSGNVKTEMVMIIQGADCEDAAFTYICRSELSNRAKNSASATFTAQLKPPDIFIRAEPSKSEYGQKDTVQVTCGSDEAVALKTQVSKEQTFQWECNDVDGWKPVPEKDVARFPSTPTAGCFLWVATSTLTVRVEEFKTCARRFRCFVGEGSDGRVDNAKEFLVEQSFECMSEPVVLGTGPAVSIIAVLAGVVLTLTLAYCCHRQSQKIRAKKKAMLQQQIDCRILSPMTPGQRDQMLKDKLKDNPVGTLPSPQFVDEDKNPIRLKQDFLPAGEAKKKMDEEDDDDDEKKKKKKTQQQTIKTNIFIVEEDGTVVSMAASENDSGSTITEQDDNTSIASENYEASIVSENQDTENQASENQTTHV